MGGGAESWSGTIAEGAALAAGDALAPAPAPVAA
jgi:hypothetical protein